MSTVLVQLLLILVMFSEDALDFILDMTASLTLVPYLFAARYALKLTLTRETYQVGRSLRPDMLIAGAATFYTMFLIWAAGWPKLLLSLVLYLPAIVLYWRARRENGDEIFAPYEVAIYALVTLGGIAGLYGVLSGAIVL
jgi:arginine:ornithine antiporter/lysine permease